MDTIQYTEKSRSGMGTHTQKKKDVKISGNYLVNKWKEFMSWKKNHLITLDTTFVRIYHETVFLLG